MAKTTQMTIPTTTPTTTMTQKINRTPKVSKRPPRAQLRPRKPCRETLFAARIRVTGRLQTAPIARLAPTFNGHTRATGCPSKTEARRRRPHMAPTPGLSESGDVGARRAGPRPLQNPYDHYNLAASVASDRRPTRRRVNLPFRD